MNWYNDIDPKACAWTRELIRQKQIPDGMVDCRSVLEVQPHEIESYTQCHFFNGIAGWAHALDLAGWSRTRPVWCASLPCQPFSSAGQQKGLSDERHLWPHFFRLVRESSPGVVIGEQVAGAVGFGWLDGVFADLEACSYTCGAVVLGAHSAGAPHIRQRLYWVAYTEAGRRGWNHGRPETTAGLAERCEHDGVAYAEHATKARLGCDSGKTIRHEEPEVHRKLGVNGGMAESHGAENLAAEPGQCVPGEGCDPVGGMADAQGGNGQVPVRQGQEEVPESGGRSRSHWEPCDLIPCRDGKARRTQPGLCPLAHGVPGRVGLLRGYGNAIVPPTAAIFIQAVMEELQK